MRSIILAVAAGIAILSPGHGFATVVDYSSVDPGFTAGSQGLSMSFDGVTVTARSGLLSQGVALDPLPPLSQGTAANVYWGTLGNLGVTGQNYTGLGVQRTNQSGTTGRPVEANEGLVFTFDRPVFLQSIAFTLEGLLNSNLTDDVFALRVAVLTQVGHGGVNSQVNNTGTDLVTSVIQTFSLSDPGFWPDPAFSQMGVSAISIQSINGAFGVSALSFDALPEPGTPALLGFGVGGLAVLRKRRRPA